MKNATKELESFNNWWKGKPKRKKRRYRRRKKVEFFEEL